MKTKHYSLLVLLLTIFISLVLSCSNSTGPDEDHTFPAAIDSVATDITLYVFADDINIFGGNPSMTPKIPAPIYGLALDTLEMTTEGSITIDIEDHNSYKIYAEADGFYTELYKCNKSESITVDLDAFPDEPYSLTGVIFEQSDYSSDCYFKEKNIVLTAVGGSSIYGTTDSLGRYGFSNLDQNEYILHFNVYGGFTAQLYNSPNTDYKDLYYISDFMVDAPNLYLYPEATMDIDITVEFPGGGRIVNSEPSYNNGWSVNVTPGGLIDGQYNYLFYETSQYFPLNIKSGWLLDGSDLDAELRYMLMNLGYIGREIDDFIDYWLPRFGTPKLLVVYPQDVESMIKVNIEPAPNEFLRNIFLFVTLEYPIQLEELPLPDTIQRNGFTAVEWGGILIE